MALVKTINFDILYNELLSAIATESQSDNQLVFMNGFQNGISYFSADLQNVNDEIEIEGSNLFKSLHFQLDMSALTGSDTGTIDIYTKLNSSGSYILIDSVDLVPGTDYGKISVQTPDSGLMKLILNSGSNLAGKIGINYVLNNFFFNSSTIKNSSVTFTQAEINANLTLKKTLIAATSKLIVPLTCYGTMETPSVGAFSSGLNMNVKFDNATSNDYRFIATGINTLTKMRLPKLTEASNFVNVFNNDDYVVEYTVPVLLTNGSDIKIITVYTEQDITV